MADSSNPLEQVLLSMGLDLSPVTEAKNVLKSVLTELNTLSNNLAQLNKTADLEHLTSVQKAAAAAVQAATQEVAEKEKVRAATAAQTEEYRKQEAAQKAITAALGTATEKENQKWVALKQQTAELEKQKLIQEQETAQIQKQIAELRLKNATTKPGDSFKGTEIIGGAILGQGLMGALGAGGQFALVNFALQQAVHWVESFYEKLKHATEEAAKFSQVSDVFDRLAHGAGMNAKEMLDGMRKSTEGLVDDLTLTKVGIAGVNSVAKLSSAQIQQLTGDVVRLAEAHGGNAAQAMERLQRGLERGQINSRMLGLGIQQAELQLKGLPPAMGAAAKSSLQMAHAIEVIHKRAMELGELPQTLEQMEQRIHVLGKNLFMAFGKGFNESEGAQTMIRYISEIVMKMGGLTEVAEAFGRKLGSIMAVAGPALMAVWEVLKAIWKVISLATDVAVAFFNVFTGSSPDEASDKITKIAHAFLYVSIGIGVVTATIKSLLQNIGAVSQVLADLVKMLGQAATGNFAGASQTANKFLTDVNLPKVWAQTWKENFESVKKEYGGMVAEFDEAHQKAKDSLGKKHGDIERPDLNSGLSAGQKAKLEALRKQLRMEEAKEELAVEKEKLEEFKRLEQEAYRDGLISIKQYEDDRRNIAKSEMELRQKDIDTEHQANKDEMASKQALGMFIPGEYKLRAEREEESYKRRIVQNQAQYQKELSQIDEEGARDRRAARQKELQEELQEFTTANQHALSLLQERNREEQSLNEKRFNKGEVGPDSYFQKQVELTKELSEAEITSALEVAHKKIETAEQEYQNSVKNETNKLELKKKTNAAWEDLDYKTTKARMDGEKALTALLEAEAQKRLEFVEKKYKPQQQALETQISYGKEGTPKEVAETEQMLERLTQNLAAQRTELFQALQTAQPYSDVWYQIYSKIEQTYQSQRKYNEELEKMRDILQPIGQLFQGIGKGIGQVFHSKFAQNLADQLTHAGEYGQNVKKQVDIVFGRKPTVEKSPEMIKLEQQAGTMFDKVGQSSTRLGSQTDQVANRFSQLTAAVDAAIAKLREMAGGGTTPIPGATEQGGAEETDQGGSSLPTEGKHEGWEEPVSGMATSQASAALQQFTTKVLAGAQAAVGFVESLTQSKSTIGGVLGGGMAGASLGLQVGGPIGAAIGAAVGATLGGIFGHKNAEVKKNLDSNNAQFKTIMQEFANNTNNLNLTINRMVELNNQVKQEQANSKKGSGDYQKQIDQYNDQITQLQTQQAQVLRDMREQMAILQMPSSAQGYLSDLKGILEQYEKFEGAAQNAKDLADANQFLVTSLKNYEDNLENELATDNEKAIQDALQLNDLIYSRTQAIQQYNQQLQSIMSQGVLTRQQTRAQSIGSQVQQLNQSYSRQMEQLNEEISAAQYKVTAEQQMFSIASTRVGLEAQLLTLQNRQTDLDMVRIAALQSLVAQLGSKDFGNGALGALLAAMPGVNNGQAGGDQNLLQLLMGLAANISQSTQAQSLEDLVTAAYQDRAAQGYAEFRGQTI